MWVLKFVLSLLKSNYVTSIIRTAVPALVGVGLTWLAKWAGWDGVLPDMGEFTAAVVGAAYYAVVRWLESRWAPAGVALGVPAQPAYRR